MNRKKLKLVIYGIIIYGFSYYILPIANGSGIAIKALATILVAFLFSGVYIGLLCLWYWLNDKKFDLKEHFNTDNYEGKI